jgi:transposase-like protein
MARANKRKNISKETKQNVIRQYYIRNHKQEDIAADLGIGLSSVERILTQYRRDSAGLSVPTLRVLGRSRVLCAADVDVGLSFCTFTRSHGSLVLGWLGSTNPRHVLV